MLREMQFQVPGLGRRVSGSGLQVRVQVSGNIFPTANRSPLTPVMGRGATAWRPWADGGCGSDYLPGSTMISLRTDATQSRPYLDT